MACYRVKFTFTFTFTFTEQADDNHNKQQDQAFPQWLWYNILTFLRDGNDHNTL
jgi:hypothetical protein